MTVALAVAATAAIAFAAPSLARGEDPQPETSHLVLAGLAMALPTYAVGVIAHEGSHALAAKMVGAEVTELHLLPGVYRGKFYFGYVRVRGLKSEGERRWFLLAPKLVDVAMLGAYSAMVWTGNVPDNAYGGLALAVLATGFWVDFSKDIPSFFDHSDIVKLYNSIGATNEWRRLPLRILHAGVSVTFGFALARGYRAVFEGNEEPAPSSTAIALPLWSGRF